LWQRLNIGNGVSAPFRLEQTADRIAVLHTKHLHRDAKHRSSPS